MTLYILRNGASTSYLYGNIHVIVSDFDGMITVLELPYYKHDNNRMIWEKN